MNPAARFTSSKEARQAALERQIQELMAQREALNAEEDVYTLQQSSMPVSYGGRPAQYSGPPAQYPAPPANHGQYAPQYHSQGSFQPMENITAHSPHSHYRTPVSSAQTSYQPQPPPSQSTHQYQQQHPRTVAQDLRMSIAQAAASRVQALPITFPNTTSATSGNAYAPQRGTNGQHQPPPQQYRLPAPQPGPSGHTVVPQNQAPRPPQSSRPQSQLQTSSSQPQPQASSSQPRPPPNTNLPATTPEHKAAIEAHKAHARRLDPSIEEIWKMMTESDEGTRNYICKSEPNTVPWGDHRDVAFFWDTVDGRETVSMLLGIKKGSNVGYVPNVRGRAFAAYRRYGRPSGPQHPPGSRSTPADQSTSNDTPSSSSSLSTAQQPTSSSSAVPVDSMRMSAPPSVPPQMTTSIAGSSSRSPPPTRPSNSILNNNPTASGSGRTKPIAGGSDFSRPIASGSGQRSLPTATNTASPYVPAFIRGDVFTLKDPPPPKKLPSPIPGAGTEASTLSTAKTPVNQQPVASTSSLRGGLSSEPVAPPIRQMLNELLSAPPPGGRFTPGTTVGAHTGPAGHDKGKGKEFVNGQALPSPLRPCDADKSTLAHDVLRALGLNPTDPELAGSAAIDEGVVTSADGTSSPADGMTSPVDGITSPADETISPGASSGANLAPQTGTKRPLADEDQEESLQPVAKRQAVDAIPLGGEGGGLGQAGMALGARPIAMPTMFASPALGSATPASTAYGSLSTLPDTTAKVRPALTPSISPAAPAASSFSSNAPPSTPAPSSFLLAHAPPIYDTPVTALPHVSVTALPIPPRPQTLSSSTSLQWRPVKTSQSSGEASSAPYPSIVFKAGVGSNSASVPTPAPPAAPTPAFPSDAARTPTPGTNGTAPISAGRPRIASEASVPFVNLDLQMPTEAMPLVNQRSQSQTAAGPPQFRTPRSPRSPPPGTSSTMSDLPAESENARQRVHQLSQIQRFSQAGSSKLSARETSVAPSFGVFSAAKNPFVDLGSIRKDSATKVPTPRQLFVASLSAGRSPHATPSARATSTPKQSSTTVTPPPLSPSGPLVASSTLVPTSPGIDTNAQDEGPMAPSSPTLSHTPVGPLVGEEPSEAERNGEPSQRLNKRKRSRVDNWAGAFVLVPPAPDWVKRVQQRTGSLDPDGRLGSSAEEARKEAGLSEYEKQTLSESLATLASKPCGWRNCTTVLNSSQSLRAHVKRHWDGVQHYPFLCSWTGCERKFATNDGLLKHLIRHSDRTGLDCPLTGCDARSSTTLHLLKHYSSCRELRDELHLKPRSVPHAIATSIAVSDDYGQDQGPMPVYLMEAPVVNIPLYSQGQEPWLRASIHGIPRCDGNATIRPRRRRLDEALKTITNPQPYASVGEPTIHTTYRSTPRKLLKSGFSVDIPVFTDPAEFYNSGGSNSDGRSQIDFDEHSPSRGTSIGVAQSEPGASVTSGDDPLLITDERNTPNIDTGDELMEVQDLLQEVFDDVDV